MNFLYFAPHIAPNKIQTTGLWKRFAADNGLQYLGVADPNKLVMTQRGTPGSNDHGTYFAIRPIDGTEPQLLTDRDEMIWHAIPGGSVSVGCLPDEPPQPRSVLRSQIALGYDVTDCAGRNWTIPIARSPLEHRLTVPSDYRFDLTTGTARRQLKQTYRWLWDLSGEIYDHFYTDAPEKSKSLGWLAVAAAKILGVNYRVSGAELNLLSDANAAAIDDSTAQLICALCIDTPLLDEAEKKSTTADPSEENTTSSGPPGSPDITQGTGLAGSVSH